MEDIIEIEKKIKRFESNIVISGTWFIVFGFWSVLKLVITLVYSEKGVQQLFGELELDTLLEKAILVIAFILFALGILAVHAYIGMKAISYGKGKKRKRFFLFIAGFIAVVTFLGIPSYFRDWHEGHLISMVDDTKIAAALVDVALVYILLDMIISAIRLGMCNKKLKEQEA